MRRGKRQFPADNVGETAFLQHERRFVEQGQRPVLDDAVPRNVAKQRDLIKNGRLKGTVTAQNDDVRMDAHPLKLLDGVLGGLGLVLFGSAQVRDESDMDEKTVFPACLQRDLSGRFDKRLALDVPDRSPDLGDNDIRVCM